MLLYTGLFWKPLIVNNNLELTGREVLMILSKMSNFVNVFCQVLNTMKIVSCLAKTKIFIKRQKVVRLVYTMKSFFQLKTIPLGLIHKFFNAWLYLTSCLHFTSAQCNYRSRSPESTVIAWGYRIFILILAFARDTACVFVGYRKKSSLYSSSRIKVSIKFDWNR